jgi:hypothetical protein
MWPHGINFGFVFSPLVWWRRTTRLAGGWWRVLIYSKSDLFWEKSTAGWWLISQANKLTVRDRCKLLRGRPRILSVLQFGRWSWPHDVLRWSMSFYVWKSFGFFFSYSVVFAWWVLTNCLSLMLCLAGQCNLRSFTALLSIDTWKMKRPPPVRFLINTIQIFGEDDNRRLSKIFYNQ